MAEIKIQNYKITFEPTGTSVQVARGTSLLQAALSAGLHLNASCGGTGTCGSCKVWLREGTLDTTRTAGVPRDAFSKGLRLACQSRVEGNVLVEIPATPLIAPVRPKDDFQGAQPIQQITATGWSFQPLARKIRLKLKAPSTQDNKPDLKRLRQALATKGIKDFHTTYEVLKALPEVLRAGKWHVTATIVSGRPNAVLSRLEPGNTTKVHYGANFDIGTTAVRGQLLDLNIGQPVAEAIEYNRQSKFGEDVISRIGYCRKDGGLQHLQTAVTDTINSLLSSMLAKADVHPLDISHMVVAANTVMTQMLFGVNPEPLRLSPYVPAFDSPPQVPAHSLGIDLPEHVLVYALPCVASYVGSDIVSGIIGSGVYQRERISLYIDLGTNGEIVAGNKDWLVTAACSAGPTFEGGGIKAGMLATTGAIEDFRLDAPCAAPYLKVIGSTKPSGICGSGLINTIAALLEKGILAQNGRFNLEINCSRLRHGDDGYEYILADAGNSRTGSDIVLTEMDIDNFLRSKAAIYAGCQTLVKSVGLGMDDVEDIIIAGTFGSNINIESAVKVGLLPDVPREKFHFIGNGSLLGARLTSLSHQLYMDGMRVADMMTNFELSDNSIFMDNYVASLFLPHTDRSRFPSVEVGI